MSYYFVSAKYEDQSSNDMILTIRYRPCWILRLFGFQEKLIRFLGDCTVWNQLPSYKSAGTIMSGMLVEFWKMAKHKKLIKPASAASRAAPEEKP